MVYYAPVMENINWLTVLLLVVSNFIMAYAWYGHLGGMSAKPLWTVVLTSWSIALLEYCFAVPANRLGARTMSLEQLKITQEAISLLVFIPFSIFCMKQPVSWNYAAAFACILGAVYFIFRP